MKTSIKIGVALIVVMLSGITYSNLGLKKKFDAIDKSDVFWDYDLREKLTFSKLVIEGGNRAHVTIVKEKGKGKGGIAYNNDLKDLISYKVINDTLKIVFDKSLVEGSKGNVKKLKHRVGISYSNLDAVRMTNSWGALKIEKIPSLFINLSGQSYLQIDSPSQELNVFDITLDDDSMMNFKNSKSEINVGLLKAKILDSASANLQTIYPEKMQLVLEERAEITLKGKSWDALEKELESKKAIPKTTLLTQD